MPRLAIPKLQISMTELSRTAGGSKNEDLCYLIIVGINGDGSPCNRLEPQPDSSGSFGWKANFQKPPGGFVVYEERLAELETAHLRFIFGRSQSVSPTDLAWFAASWARDDSTAVVLREAFWIPPLSSSFLAPDQLLGEFTLKVQHDSGQLRPLIVFGEGAQPVRDASQKAEAADFFERLKRLARIIHEGCRSPGSASASALAAGPQPSEAPKAHELSGLASGDPNLGLVAEWSYAFVLSAAGDAIYHTKMFAQLIHTIPSRLEG